MRFLALAVLLAATAPHAATTPVDKCPLHVEQFTLAARGSTAHVDRYVVGLQLSGRLPVSASLGVPGLDQGILTPVIGPGGNAPETIVHYVVDLPHALSAQAIRVLGVLLHGSTDTEITCKSSPFLVSLTQSIATIDDSSMTGSQMMYPQAVTEAHIIRAPSAAYPGTERQLGHQGTAIVVVTVGARGAVLAAKIDRSSGYPALDDAALAAARRMTFSEPQYDGAPIPLDYFVTYAFSAH